MAPRSAETSEPALGSVADALRFSAVPWLAAPQRQIAAARQDGRLAHALLIHGVAGCGQSALSLWTAQLVLCRENRDQPCGRCDSCVLFLAGNHPDFHPTGIEEKASFIKVDQIRDLCSRLAMRSFRGAAKVALIDPADRMNPSSHNALLKTLEEPTDDTLLLLTATRIDRLPPTVASRCQRIRIPAPPAGNAVAWLQSRAARDDWPQLLALAAGAPLRALELAESGAGELLQDMAAALPGPPASAFDPFGLAEAWSKDRPADRLAWLEWWLESRIRRWATVSDVVNNNRDNDLPSVPAEPNIRTAFALLERVRDARAQLEGPLNSLLLFEDLLVSFAEAFAGSTVARPETQG